VRAVLPAWQVERNTKQQDEAKNNKMRHANTMRDAIPPQGPERNTKQQEETKKNKTCHAMHWHPVDRIGSDHISTRRDQDQPNILHKLDAQYTNTLGPDRKQHDGAKSNKPRHANAMRSTPPPRNRTVTQNSKTRPRTTKRGMQIQYTIHLHPGSWTLKRNEKQDQEQ
jgi:hypothetical protein